MPLFITKENNFFYSNVTYADEVSMWSFSKWNWRQHCTEDVAVSFPEIYRESEAVLGKKKTSKHLIFSWFCQVSLYHLLKKLISFAIVSCFYIRFSANCHQTAACSSISFCASSHEYYFCTCLLLTRNSAIFIQPDRGMFFLRRPLWRILVYMHFGYYHIFSDKIFISFLDIVQYFPILSLWGGSPIAGSMTSSD